MVTLVITLFCFTIGIQGMEEKDNLKEMEKDWNETVNQILDKSFQVITTSNEMKTDGPLILDKEFYNQLLQDVNDEQKQRNDKKEVGQKEKFQKDLRNFKEEDKANMISFVTKTVKECAQSIEVCFLPGVVQEKLMNKFSINDSQAEELYNMAYNIPKTQVDTIKDDDESTGKKSLSKETDEEKKMKVLKRIQRLSDKHYTKYLDKKLKEYPDTNDHYATKAQVGVWLEKFLDQVTDEIINEPPVQEQEEIRPPQDGELNVQKTQSTESKEEIPQSQQKQKSKCFTCGCCRNGPGKNETFNVKK